jgi:hypothetical protein
VQPEARGRINTARCVTEKVGSIDIPAEAVTLRSGSVRVSFL